MSQAGVGSPSGRGVARQLRRAPESPHQSSVKRLRLAASSPESVSRSALPRSLRQCRHPGPPSGAQARFVARSSELVTSPPTTAPASLLRPSQAEQEKALRRRVQQRLRLNVESIVIPGRTSLELMSVGPATRKAYAKLLMQLAAWTLGVTNSPLTVPDSLGWLEAITLVLSMGSDPEVLDDAIAEFTNVCFWKGEHASIGNRLNSAISWSMPQYSKWGSAETPRSKQAAAAAARSGVGSTRLPLPRTVLAAIVMTMAFLERARGRDVDAAIAAWTGAHAYLRPGELGRLVFRWITIGVANDKGRAALLLHPAEGSRASKTGEYDETVVVDDPILVRALARLKGRRGADEPLMGHHPVEFWSLFTAAVEKLKLHLVLGRQVPYVLRHTGASSDAWSKSRDLAAIQSRGRWKTAASVRRYAKGGRVAHQQSLCGAQLIKFGEESETLLEQVFLRQREPLRPPPPSAL